jgi:hypothetical protein
MAAFSGFYESHKPPPSEDARGIVPVHCYGHETTSKVGSFCIVVPFAVALAAAGAIRSDWSPDDGVYWLLL